MRIPRIYIDHTLHIDSAPGSRFSIEGQAAHHISRVLRMGVGRQIKLFNGKNSGYFQATIQSLDKKSVRATVEAYHPTKIESPLSIHLGQAISKGERMDFTIQKSVELGVRTITPLWVERCEVKLSADRAVKKQAHWQQIAISACEQCGRDVVPHVTQPIKLDTWLANVTCNIRWVLDPRGKPSKPSLSPDITSASLLVGPEGGLTDSEVALAKDSGFEGKLIGPRVLRTETAALTAIGLLQYQWGDFGGLF